MSERYHLDTSVAVIEGAGPGAELLERFQGTRAHAFVIWDPAQSRQTGLVLGRAQLLDDVVDAAFRSASLRNEWLTRLEAHPAMLGPLIAANILKLPIDLPRGVMHIELSAHVQQPVHDYLNEYLNKHSRRLQLEARVVDASRLDQLSRADLRRIVIAVRGTQVVGVAFARKMRGGRGRRLRSDGVDTTPPPTSAFRGSAAQATPDTGVTPAAAGETPPPFIAHPRLDVDGPARAGQALPFKVGFCDRPDPDADITQRINIPQPVAGESMVVLVSADGATIIEPSMVTLRLDFTDSHEFTAIVSEGVTQVQLRACYNYRGKPVGHIVKAVNVGERPRRAGQKIKHVSAVGLPRPTTHHEEIAGLDVILYVHKQGTSALSWQAYVPATGEVHGAYVVGVEDTAQFAKQLAGLRSFGDESPSARDELFVTGQRIAELIPPEIVDHVLAPVLKQHEVPAMLIYTDEPFIPWELARPDPKRLGRTTPACLGALARIGRWWSGASLPGPRSSRSIQHLSAVAAAQFTGNQATLKHAIAERTWLKTEFANLTTEVEAIQPDMDAWLDRPRRASHLGHIALHGYSDAQNDAQGLILADGSVLTPNRLAGQYYEGDTPRFEMVFLNACQVGTAGQRLGRMAGFPGSLLLGGASGFIGPLWEVDDAIALSVAKTFYERVFKDQVEVGEALRGLRGTPPHDNSITPWAYLFYGHPRLQLLL